MQLGHTRLTPAERQGGSPRVGASTTANLDTDNLVHSTIQVYREFYPVQHISSETVTSGHTHHPPPTMQMRVLLDSGADMNLMDIGLVDKLGLGLKPLPEPLSATAVDGKLLCT